MSNDEQSEAVEVVQIAKRGACANFGTHVDASEEDEEADPPQSPAVLLEDWQGGSEDWPVSEADLKRVTGCSAGGVVSHASRLRWQAMTRLSMMATNSVPSQKTYTVRLSCGQKHPGLCLSDHNDIYESSLAMSRSFESFFNSLSVGKMYNLYDPGVEDHFCLHVCVCPASGFL